MKKQIVQIRGVIVDGWYDGEWAQEYIGRGLWTPESRFRNQLDTASKAGDELEVIISSQGGSVIAGNDILAAIQGYPHAKSITVGAFAASMAANIILQAGCPVRAHKNSILLFHGAWGVTIGGEGSHTDTAELLDQINEPIKAGLLAKGVPKKIIDEGFAEGRQFTMTAEQAKGYGIVSEIIGEAAPAIEKMTKEDEAALLAQGSTLDVAACSAWESAMPGEPPTIPVVPKASVPSPDLPEVVPAIAFEETIGRLRAELTQARTQASSVQSACDKRISALMAEHKISISELQAKFDSTQAEYTAFRAQTETEAQAATDRITDLEGTLTKEKDAHAQLSGQALLGNGEGSDDAPTSWPDAVSKFGLAVAQKRFPELAKAYKETHQPKK